MANTACVHKSAIGCALTALPGCCHCSDSRPHADAYPIYVDGEGMKMRGKRWSRYCWKCRDHWNQFASTSVSRGESSNRPLVLDPTWAFPILDLESSVARPRSRHHPQLEQLPPETSHTPRSVPNHQLAPLSLRGGRPGHTEHDNAFAQGNSSQEPTLPSPTRNGPRAPLRNPFGTREELEAEDYQSPISSMFTRAWDRYRTAETERRQTEAEIQDLILESRDLSRMARTRALERRNLQLSDEIQNEQLRLNALQASHANPFQRRDHNPFQPRDRRFTPNPFQSSTTSTTQQPTNDQPTHRRESTTVTHSTHNPAVSELRALALAQQAADLAERVAARTQTHRQTPPHGHPYPTAQARSPNPSPPRPNPIDAQPRPPSLSASDMTVSLACRICNEQRCDTLLEPCMHVAMCRWCSEIIRSEGLAAQRRGRRTATGDREGGWKCPICRAHVVGARRIYLC